MKKLLLLLPLALMCMGLTYVKGIGWMSSPRERTYPEQLGGAYLLAPIVLDGMRSLYLE